VTETGPPYDRALLLAGARRNAVLDLEEVRRYGADSYRDPDYVSIYGLPPAEWYARGIRLLGRTAVECTRDDLGDAIGRDVAGIALMAPSSEGTRVIDLFAGSGNTLSWMLRHQPGARGLGFELDAAVFGLTRRNLAILGLPIDVANVDYRSGLADAAVPADHLVVVFVAPPWGGALGHTTGLDLRRTTPPIAEIVDVLATRFEGHRILCAIQIHETVEPASLAELTPRFDWSARRIYSLNAPGENHGVLLGTRGWAP
jgi:hypothetical protein